MRRDMERMFEETIRDIDHIPKELVREFETPRGKVREVGPLVYGYSATVGQDGKPKVREFGNVRSSVGLARPSLTAEREPLTDVITSEKDIKVTVEMPGISKQDIKINAYEGSVEISTTETASKKYRRTIELPPDADVERPKKQEDDTLVEACFHHIPSSKEFIAHTRNEQNVR